MRHAEYQMEEPRSWSESHVRELHLGTYVDYLAAKCEQLVPNEVFFPSFFAMDRYTPLVRHTFAAAIDAVNVALTAAELVAGGSRIAYGLCRPPGHHAERAAMAGYCYFNNAAIAARSLGNGGRVAILDIDVHHGNGTQNFFYDSADVLYVSLHGDPRFTFPYSSGYEDERGRGEGLGFNRNLPIPPGTDDTGYVSYLDRALDAIYNYAPRYLVISAGFDTYEHDPVGNVALTETFYGVMGERVGSIGIPTLVLQEGGYHIGRIGPIVHAFLSGMNSAGSHV